jgi:hypothetical protein
VVGEVEGRGGWRQFGNAGEGLTTGVEGEGWERGLKRGGNGMGGGEGAGGAGDGGNIEGKAIGPWRLDAGEGLTTGVC